VSGRSSPGESGQWPQSARSVGAPTGAGVVAAACLAYVLWRPVSNQAVLLPVLGVLAAASTLLVLRSRGQIASRHLRAVVAGTILIFFVGLTVGSIRNNPGLLHQGQLWLGMLAIWLPWSLSIRLSRTRALLEILAVVLSVLSAVIVLYVAAERGLGPAVIPQSVLVSQEAGFAETQGGSAIRLYGLSTLAAGGPLMAACMVVRRDDLLPRRWLSVMAGVLVVLAAMLAGRRAIAAVTLASPVVAILIQAALRPSRRKLKIPPWVVVSAPAVALLVILLPAAASLVARGWAAIRDGAALFLGLGSAVTVDKGLDDELRQNSADELLTAWGTDPILGSGLGAELPSGFARNFERPWLFELQYHQFLFNFGLVGALWAVCMVVVALSATRAAAKKMPEHVPVMAACLTAAICLLIANGSNPYLQTFGHGWGLALAAGIINAMLTSSVRAEWAVSLAEQNSRSRA
jgi:hypothetical protein